MYPHFQHKSVKLFSTLHAFPPTIYTIEELQRDGYTHRQDQPRDEIEVLHGDTGEHLSVFGRKGKENCRVTMQVDTEGKAFMKLEHVGYYIE